MIDIGDLDVAEDYIGFSKWKFRFKFMTLLKLSTVWQVYEVT
jgi:hypothetical protein